MAEVTRDESWNHTDIDSSEGVSCSVERTDYTAAATAENGQNPGPVLLADHTTFHVGGPAKTFVLARTEDQVLETVRDCDRRGEPVLILSGGSNLVIGDGGFDGTVVKMATRGVVADVSGCGGAFVRVEAGEVWDDFVAFAVDKEWIGIETLSGIPGLVGATPIQNVGAYGSDVSQTIARVRTLDRTTGDIASFAAADCGFSYRMSRFKAEPERYVVLTVWFQFLLGNLSTPIRYPELAKRLGVEVGQRVDTQAVRQAVLEIRRGKGMVIDPADHDTWSAGSFFTNPILTPAQADALPPEAPRFAAGGELVKTSAAWLIDHAGFHKGYGSGPVTVSTRHTLALTNRGQATAADVANLAREIRTGVEQRFGITLVPEPVVVGLEI